ncbi:MAG: Uma2 family endonuclease, partial [candidate division WOR-3 bacterium]
KEMVKERIWTYEDYLKLEDDKRYEVINGRLVEMPAPNFEHQKILKRLLILLVKFVESGESLGEVIPAPFDVILSKTVVVQPDIVYISKGSLKNIKEGRMFGLPDLVIEIISPSTTRRDTVVKKGIYQEFGVKECWIVYPYEKAIEVWVLDDKGNYELYSFAEGKGKVKSKVLEGLEIDLEEVFK